eukprot:7593212-Lingulodinium_polyedra.AAC.1
MTGSMITTTNRRPYRRAKPSINHHCGSPSRLLPANAWVKTRTGAGPTGRGAWRVSRCRRVATRLG